MQMSKIASDIAVYWSNVGLSHAPVDDTIVPFTMVAVSIHDISELHVWSVHIPTTQQHNSKIKLAY